MKIAIVTDSTAVMEQTTLDKYKNLHTVPLQILFGDDVYKDFIDLDTNKFFDLFDTSKVLPTTSQPSVGAVLELFEKLSEDYEQIIYITISSKISGTYNTGVLARNQLPEHEIVVFDSLNTSVIQQRMVLEALRMAEEGKHLFEIIEHLEYLRDNANIYLVVDDLKHLGRTGRVNNVSAVMGALLKIKPILRFEDGFINLYQKIRTLNKAHTEVLTILENEDLKDSSFIMIAHAKGYESALKAKEKILEMYPGKDVVIGELSPVISVHTGPNSLGIAWIK